MKTFDEWYDSQPMVIVDRRTDHHLTWNASAENSAEEIAKRDERIAELESRLNEVALDWQMLAAKNNQLRIALDIAHAHADSLADSPVEMRIVNAARLSPDLSSPVLNRVKAGAYREAANICDTEEIPFDIDVWLRSTKKEMTALTAKALGSIIRARADAIEKGEGNATN